MSRSLDMHPEDYDWQPPSEAELKVIQARRERSDKISHLMGEYLLKRYKMLGVTCDICETILLETPSGEKYCIACKELDQDAEKDNPVFQAQALPQKSEQPDRERSEAISKLLGDYLMKGFKMLGSTCSVCDGVDNLFLASESTQFTMTTILLQDRSGTDFCVCCELIDKKTKQGNQPVSQALGPLTQRKDVRLPSKPEQQLSVSVKSETQKVLESKIEWATEQLQASCSVDYSIQLCNLIKSAADAILSLQTICLNTSNR